MPVLVVDPVVLRDVEPHQPERAVLAHSVEQVADLRGLAGLRSHGGLRQQQGLAGQDPHLGDRLAEHAAERVRRTVVVAVDADPGDVLAAGPPGRDGRCGAGLVRLQGPQPGDVAHLLGAEQRHHVPPRGHERRGWSLAVAPGVPGGVHLVAEPDDHRLAEAPDAVGVRAQVAVVVTRGDLGDREVGGIDLHHGDRSVRVHRLRERGLERLLPATVVPDQVRRPARRLGELRHRLVGLRRPALVDAQIRGRAGGQAGARQDRCGARRGEADHRGHDCRRGHRGGGHDHQPGPHPPPPPGQAVRDAGPLRIGRRVARTAGQVHAPPP